MKNNIIKNAKRTRISTALKKICKWKISIWKELESFVFKEMNIHWDTVLSILK